MQAVTAPGATSVGRFPSDGITTTTGRPRERIYHNARRGLLPLEGAGLADLTFPSNWPPKDLRRQRSRHGFDDPQFHADDATSDDPEADSDDELTDNGEDLDPDSDFI